MISKKLNTYNLLNFLLDLVFPKYCVGCGIEGCWICPNCYKKIVFIKYPYCPSCNKLTPNGQFCRRCREKSYLTGVIICTHYEEGPLKEAIHTFKYDCVYGIAKDLGKILYKSLKYRKIKNVPIVIPVPLHRSKQAMRGFNQSELLALEIKQHFPNTIVNKELIKYKKSARQTDLTRSERLKNAKGLYKWIGQKNMYKNKIVYLIDDVFTTGATLQECAKVLKCETGAKQVWGIVLAKG